MEHAPSERKPNRRFKGRIHFAISEAFGWRQHPPQPIERIEYEDVGIGTTTELPLFRVVEDPFPNNWENLPPAS